MKKVTYLISILATALFTNAASAAATGDFSQALLNFKGTVGGIVEGSTFGITGQDGGEVKGGILIIASDGSFVSQMPVKLEARPVDVTGAIDTTSFVSDSTISWSVESVAMSSTAFDSTAVDVLLNDQSYLTAGLGSEVVATDGTIEESSVLVSVKYPTALTDITAIEGTTVTASVVVKATVSAGTPIAI